MEISNGIVIRPFKKEDRCMVSAFFDQMSGETRAFFDRGSGNRKTALNFFDEDNSSINRFMAVKEDRMVGYVFLWDMDKGVPWLGIAVAEDYKGMHLGRSLIEYANNHAKLHGKGGVLLTTAFANIRGQSLYERMGYEHIGTHNSGELLFLFRFKDTL